MAFMIISLISQKIRHILSRTLIFRDQDWYTSLFSGICTSPGLFMPSVLALSTVTNPYLTWVLPKRFNKSLSFANASPPISYDALNAFAISTGLSVTVLPIPLQPRNVAATANTATNIIASAPPRYALFDW